MRRSIFFLSVAGAVAALASFRVTGRRRSLRSGAMAGRCADSRRKLRWSGYTAADFA